MNKLTFSEWLALVRQYVVDSGFEFSPNLLDFQSLYTDETLAKIAAVYAIRAIRLASQGEVG